MNQNFFKTNVTLLLLGAVLSMAVLSCQSNKNDRDTKGYSFQSSRQSGGSSGGGPGEGQGGPGMQMPQLAESTELLLKIDEFADSDNPLVVLTEGQGAMMIPVLMEWKEELEAGQNASTDEFMNVINGQLSVAQAEYELTLGPPSSENGKPQGPPPGANGSSDRPMGPPSDVELLADILDKLS